MKNEEAKEDGLFSASLMHLCSQQIFMEEATVCWVLGTQDSLVHPRNL